MNNAMKLIKALSDLSELCDVFSDNVSLENGEKIVEKIDECDEIYSKVKEDILKLIKEKSEEEDIEEGIEIEGLDLGNGFLIKGKKDE